jgi:hypothetical protein
MITIPSLHLPDGYTTMGAPAPSLAIDGANKTYYGVQSKHNGGQYAFRVFLQPASGVAELKATLDLPGDPIESGQGQLVETGGMLVAIAFDTPGDRQPISQPVIIDGYVPRLLSAAAPTWKPIVVPAGSPLWQIWSGTYSERNLGTFARVAASMNVLKNALSVAIDLLVAAGIVVKG